MSVVEKHEQLNIRLACNLNLLLCPTDEKAKVSDVFDQQLVIVWLAVSSVT